MRKAEGRKAGKRIEGIISSWLMEGMNATER
jgi:hypothetical protein